MKALTVALALIGSLAFATTASACPYMDKQASSDTILKPKPAGS
ncbi:MAG: hypothetical protein ACPGGK_18160 [Pikeienuella sp.]